jgi:hypothetical protein
MKGIRQLPVQIIHVGILKFGIGDQGLQYGILQETQKLAVDVAVINVSKIQHTLYQGTGLNGIVGAHLLKSGKVSGCKIKTLYTVITLYLDFKSIGLFFVKGLQLEITIYQHLRQQQRCDKQKTTMDSHDKFYSKFCKSTKKYFKKQIIC